MLAPGQGQFPPRQKPQKDPGGAEGAGAPAAQPEQNQAIDQVNDGRRPGVVAVGLTLHDGLHRPAAAEQQHRHGQDQGEQAEKQRTDLQPPGQNHIDVGQVLNQPLDPQPACGQPLQPCPPGGDRREGRRSARGRGGRQRLQPTGQQQIQRQCNGQGHAIAQQRAQHEIATGGRSDGGEQQHRGADRCPPGGETQHREGRQQIGPDQSAGGRDGGQAPPAGIAITPPPSEQQHQHQQPTDEQALQPPGRAVAVAAQKRTQGLDGVVADDGGRREAEDEGRQPRRRQTWPLGGHGDASRSQRQPDL